MDLILFNFLVIMTCMVALWLLSIALNDVSFVDSFWALGFVVLAGSTALLRPDPGGPLSQIVLAITAIWGLRLAGYLFWRWRREGADPRYLRMIEKAGDNPHRFTLRAVFLLQGAMLWLVSLPIQLSLLADAGQAPGWLARAGVALRYRVRERRRLADGGLSRRSGPSRPGRGSRSVALHASPQLLR